MEQNNSEFTPEQSLELIRDTLDNNRRDILRSSSSFLILWGSILFVISLLIYFLWSGTGRPDWNFLWFAIPVIGYPANLWMSRKHGKLPNNAITSALGQTWSVFGFFSIVISVLALTCCPMNITLIIVVLFGFAECISGCLMKSWVIIIAGALFGVGAPVLSTVLTGDASKSLLFTVAGLMLALTGVLVKYSRKYVRKA